MSRDRLLTAAGYGIGVVLLSFYGGRVCPLMGVLHVRELVVMLLAGFALTWVLREVILATMIHPETSIGRRWVIDFALWLVPGLVVTVWDTVARGFPISSGIKMVIGSVALGYYASCYSSLQLEMTHIQEHLAEGTSKIRFGSYLSIAKRFRDFNLYSMTLTAATLFLLAAKQIYLLTYSDPSRPNPLAPGEPNRLAEQLLSNTGFIGEFTFVVSFLLLCAVVIGNFYHRYVSRMFRLEEQALKKIQAGDLSASVPVVSVDEFGEIAVGTNLMIGGLQDRERIKTTFGKYVGSQVAEALLREEPKLGGEHKTVAVLFTDIRGYTTLSERLKAEEVVSVLNEYFTQVVKAVERHGGTVDKFIGDAAMAVYGLTPGGEPCAAAIDTAMDVRRELDQLNQRLSSKGLPRIDNGVGIHYGTVIAGNIGSAERLEYTVIGDTVNVASRLESLTRHIGSAIAISKEAWERATPQQKSRLVFMGDHELKGKSGRIPVYGFPEPAAAAAAK